MSKYSGQNERARWQWWMVFVGAPIAILLGTVGYWLSTGSTPSVRAWMDALYRSLQLLLLRMTPVDSIHWTLELARWLAAALFGLAAVLTIIRVFREELRHICLQIPWPRHVVIFGLGPTTTQLVRCFREQGRRVVVVVPPDDTADAEVCRSKGITLVVGEPAKPAEALAKARAYRATHVIALSAEDSTNLAIVDEARKLIMKKARPCFRGGRRPVKCFAHFSDIDARTSLQTSKVFSDDPRCEVRFFDLFDAAARALLLKPDQMPLDHGGIRADDPRQVHLVILGFGRMGQSVALRAAQLGHFANRKPLRISVIDQRAERRKQALLFRYPNFEKTCQLEFHELEMESLLARQLVEEWCADKTNAVSVAACFDRDSLALEVALRMKGKLDVLQVPMFVRMASRAGFASVLQAGASEPGSQVHAFGMVEDCCNDALLENKLNEDLAQTIHEEYRKERIADIRGKGGDPSRDISTRQWDELDDGLKDSNRQQADHIDIKLHAVGLERVNTADPRAAVESLEEVELLAEMEHNRWNAERWLKDWTLGPSDKARKVTPYLVPWGELPDHIKPYDRRTVSKIPDFLRTVNQKACRKVVEA